MSHPDGKERVVLCLHTSLRLVYQNAIKIGSVIKQDFDHWIDEQGHTGPDRIDASDLLSSFDG